MSLIFYVIYPSDQVYLETKKRLNNYLKKSTEMNACEGTKYLSLLSLTSIVNQFFNGRLYLAEQYFAKSLESAKPLSLPLASPT